jgi:hypothetical protein
MSLALLDHESSRVLIERAVELAELHELAGTGDVGFFLPSGLEVGEVLPLDEVEVISVNSECQFTIDVTLVNELELVLVEILLVLLVLGMKVNRYLVILKPEIAELTRVPLVKISFDCALLQLKFSHQRIDLVLVYGYIHLVEFDQLIDYAEHLVLLFVWYQLKRLSQLLLHQSFNTGCIY